MGLPNFIIVVRGREESEFVALFLLLLFFYWFEIVILDVICGARRDIFGGRIAIAIGVVEGGGCGDGAIKGCEAGMQRLLKGGVWRLGGEFGWGGRTGGGGMGKEVAAADPYPLLLASSFNCRLRGEYRFASGRSNILLLPLRLMLSSCWLKELNWGKRDEAAWGTKIYGRRNDAGVQKPAELKRKHCPELLGVYARDLGKWVSFMLAMGKLGRSCYAIDV